MLKRVIFLGLVIKGLVADVDTLNSLNLKYMYEGAKEIEMLDKAMNAGMKEHNQVEKPLLTETYNSIVDNSSIDLFKDFGDKYILEKNILDGADVKTYVLNNTLKIDITISKKETIVMENGVKESSINSVTTEEIPIPYDGDVSRLKKSYSNGILKVEIPKGGK